MGDFYHNPIQDYFITEVNKWKNWLYSSGRKDFHEMFAATHPIIDLDEPKNPDITKMYDALAEILFNPEEEVNEHEKDI